MYTQKLSELKKGDKVSFSIYGNSIDGKFICLNEKVMTIEIIYDPLGISETGDVEEINVDFLILN